MIDIDRARELLKLAVETQGEGFIYNYMGRGMCFYIPLDRSGSADPDNDPRCKTGCLIGTALDIAGETFHISAVGGVAQLSVRHPDRMTHDAVRYFGRAQRAQDNGATWGEAYAEAESWYATASALAGR